MKKVLLTLIVTMLTCIGAWAQSGYDVSISGNKATVTSGGAKSLDAVVTEIGSDASVTTVIMPSGWTTAQLKSFAEQIVTVKTAVSTATTTKTVPAFYYDVTTNKTEYTGARGSENGHITGTVKANVTLSQVGDASYKITSSGEAYTGVYVFVQGDNVYGCEDGNVISLTKVENAYTYNDGTKKIYDASRGVTSDNKGYIGGNATLLGNADVDYYYYMNSKNYAFTSGMVFKDQNNVYYGYTSGDKKVVTLANEPYTYNANGKDYIYVGPMRTSGSDFYGYVGGTEVNVYKKSGYTYEKWGIKHDYSGITRTEGVKIYGHTGTKVELTPVSSDDVYGYIVHEYNPEKLYYVVDNTVHAEGNKEGTNGWQYYYKMEYTYVLNDITYGWFGAVYEENDTKYCFTDGEEFELTEEQKNYYKIDDIEYSLPATSYAYLDAESNEHYFINGEDKQIWKQSDDKWYTTNGDGTMPVYTLGRFMIEDEVTYGIENGVLVGSANGTLTKYDVTTNVSFINDGSGDAIYTGAIYVVGNNRYAYTDGTQVTLTQETVYTNEGNIYEGAIAENAGQYYGVAEGDKIPLTAELTYSYANPSDNKTAETETIQFTSAVPLSTEENAYEVDRIVYLTQDTKEVPAGDDLVIYVKEGGNVFNYLQSLSESEQAQITSITIGGTVNATDMKFYEWGTVSYTNSLKVVNLKAAETTNDIVKNIKSNTSITVIDADNLDIDALKTKYTGVDYGQISAVVSESDATPKEVDVLLYDATKADLSYVSSDIVNLVMGGSVNVSEGLLAQAELTGATNLVTAKLTGVETNAFANFTNTTIKRVILPDNTEISTLAKKATGAPIYQTFFTPGYTVNVAKANKVEIYTHAGALGEIKDAHYYSTDINGATRQSYFGTIDASDVAWFNGINTRELDMTQVTHASESELTAIKAALHDFNNDYIVYVALPDLGALPEEPLYTDLRNNCSNVKAVGQFDAATGGMNYYGVEPGCANVITDMLSDLTCNDQGKKNIKITRIKMSGVLNYKDIYGGGQTSACNSEGHFWVEGDGAKDSSGALEGADVVYADFSDAVFGVYTAEGFVEHPKDMTFAKAGTVYANKCKELLLPTSSLMTTIPESCFDNMQAMKELAIPNVYKYIETNAFYLFGNQSEENMRIYTINVDENGDVVETIDNGPMTVTLPASLERIATRTFHMTWHPTDVFSLKAEAPICEKDAFDGPAYWGNNGFTNEYPITRESYYNQGAAIAVLHFPNADSEAQKKKYTDLTRTYSLRDDLNTTDENGDVYLWPTQMEYGHSYLAASIGRLYGDTKYEGDGTNIYVDETKYVQADIVSEAERTFGTDNDENYIGWHQFVFTATTYTNKSNWDFSQFSDNYWWTICVPFDMTKKDVEEVFGTSADNTENRGTYVCEFTGVKRVLNNDQTSLKITLLFGTDNVASANEEDVVIQAHHSYMIKPARSTGSKTPENLAGIYAFTTKADASTVGYKPIPTTVTALDGNNAPCKYTYEETKEEVNYDYSFVGNYEPNKYVPMYSYFLGWDNSKNNVAFFREMAEGTASDKWNTFTSIIVPVHKQTTIAHIENNMIVANEEINYDCQNDDYVILDNGKQIKAISTIYEFGYTDDNGEATRIDDVNGIIPEHMKAGNVYNVNGQLVGNSVTGLSKGIYIRNGKKIIIK